MTRIGQRLLYTSAAALVALAAIACGTDTDDTAATAAPSIAEATTEAATEQVSANNASEDELEAAFESAGVENAKKWAHEVEEYRPYPEDDPTFAKLREKLAKYGPSEETLDKIISALKLP